MSYGCKCDCEDFAEHIGGVQIARKGYWNTDNFSRIQTDKRGNVLTDRRDGSNDVKIRNTNPRKELCE